MTFVTFFDNRFSPTAELLHGALNVFFSDAVWCGPIPAQAFADDEPDMYEIFAGIGVGEPVTAVASLPDVALVFLPDSEEPPVWADALHKRLKECNPSITIIWVLWSLNSYDEVGGFTPYHQPQDNMFVLNVMCPRSWPEKKGEKTPEHVLFNTVCATPVNPFTTLMEWLWRYVG